MISTADGKAIELAFTVDTCSQEAGCHTFRWPTRSNRMVNTGQGTIRIEGGFKGTNRRGTNAVKPTVCCSIEHELHGATELTRSKCRRNHLIAEQTAPKTTPKVILVNNDVILGHLQRLR